MSVFGPMLRAEGDRLPLLHGASQQDVEIVAKLLAGEHMARDSGIRQVYWAPDTQEVRLVEVTTSVEDTGEVLPFRFAPDPPDVPFESVVILLGRDDWERVKRRDLDVPPEFIDLELVAEAAGGH